LAELISGHSEDCGHAEVLHDYADWQQRDQDKVVKATDFLVKNLQ